MIESLFAAFVEIKFCFQVFPDRNDRVAEAVSCKFQGSFMSFEEDSQGCDERKQEKIFLLCQIVVFANTLSSPAEEAGNVHESERSLDEVQVKLHHSKHRSNVRPLSKQMIEEINKEQLLESRHALSRGFKRPDQATISMTIQARDFAVVLSCLVNPQFLSSPCP